MAAFWKRPRASNSWADALQPASADDAAWIRDRLLPPDLTRGVRVGDVLPTGFDAYVRIMHPVPTADGSMTWAAVAEQAGRIPHARMQWQAITYAAAGRQLPSIEGDGPAQGAFPLDLMVNLIDILSIHTSTPETAYYAFWAKAPGLPEARAAEIDHGGRPHVLLTADVSAGARPMVLDAHGAPLEPYVSPHLWWPEDHAWIVGTDVDFRSTLVAAPRACADQVVADPAFETFEVDVDDRADLGGDDQNPLPPSLAHLFS